MSSVLADRAAPGRVRSPGVALPNVIAVMNHRFLPTELDGAYLYGVVQHVVRAAKIVEDAGSRVGLVLYDRDPTTPGTNLEPGMTLGSWPSVRIGYREPTPELTGSFRRAIDALHRSWGIDPGDEPFVLYFQTGSLLGHAPPECRIVVTHHSPFVRNVASVLGWRHARRAFDWDHAKTDHLARTQEAGLRFVAEHRAVVCAEISAVQRDWLRDVGVDARQIHALPPPVGWDEATPTTPAELAAALPPPPRSPGKPSRSAGDGPTALFVVSRFDHFKNVELFLRASGEAIAGGHLHSAIVIGEPVDDRQRAAVRALVPRAARGRVHFVGRLPRSVLVNRVFLALRERAVFVCCSRFDLVPYTALEAARAGVTTIAPDRAVVGIASYLPAEYRFEPTPHRLVAKLVELSEEPDLRTAFTSTSHAIAEATSDERFADAFAVACEATRRLTDPPTVARCPR